MSYYQMLIYWYLRFDTIAIACDGIEYLRRRYEFQVLLFFPFYFQFDCCFHASQTSTIHAIGERETSHNSYIAPIQTSVVKGTAQIPSSLCRNSVANRLYDSSSLSKSQRVVMTVWWQICPLDSGSEGRDEAPRPPSPCKCHSISKSKSNNVLAFLQNVRDNVKIVSEYSETWELYTEGTKKTVLNSEVVLFLRSISTYWTRLGTEVAVLNSQGVPISQVVLITSLTVFPILYWKLGGEGSWTAFQERSCQLGPDSLS